MSEVREPNLWPSEHETLNVRDIWTDSN